MNKKTNLFKIAMRNIRAYGWMNTKLCFTFACLAFLICLFTIYNSALSEKYDSAVKERLSSNYLATTSATKYESLKETDIEFAKEDEYKARLFSKETSAMYGISMNELRTKYLTFVIDGEQYNAYSDILAGCLSEPDGGYFSDYDAVSLKALYGFDSPYLVGSRPLESDQVAISEKIFDAYNLENAEPFLGKEIECYLRPLDDSGKEPLLLFSAKLSGIIHSEVEKIAGHSSAASRPSFLFHKDSPMFQKGKSANTCHRLFLKDWPDEDTTTEWFETYGNIYYGAVSVKYITGLKNIKTLGANLYIIIGCALFFGLVLTIFLMIDKYAKVFSKFGGVLLTSGLKQKSLISLLFLQLMILSIIAVPISFILTLLGYKVITGVIMLVVNVSFEVSLSELVAMFAMGMFLVILISLLFFAYIALKLRRKTIKELLVTIAD